MPSLASRRSLGQRFLRSSAPRRSPPRARCRLSGSRSAAAGPRRRLLARRRRRRAARRSVRALRARVRFNDTPVLIGTNSDEGALFVRGGVTPAATSSSRCARVTASARGSPRGLSARDRRRGDAVSARSLSRFGCSHGPPGLGRGCKRSRKGRGAVTCTTYDHRTPQSPNGAAHADELGYVFRTLGARQRQPPRPQDTRDVGAREQLLDQFRENRDPNGAGLPAVARVRRESRAGHGLRCRASSARPLPNVQAAACARRLLRLSALAAGEGALSVRTTAAA